MTNRGTSNGVRSGAKTSIVLTFNSLLELCRVLRLLIDVAADGSREIRCNLNTFPTHNSLKIAENERLGIL